MLTNLALYVSNVRTIILASISPHRSFFQVAAQDLLLVSNIRLGDIEVTCTKTDLEALRCLEPQLEACHSLGRIPFHPTCHLSLSVILLVGFGSCTYW
jgi:hypothetical protein